MEVNDVHFETTDFQGRKIICRKSQWYDHIVRNPSHNYMDGAESDVIDALQNPHRNLRNLDRAYDNRRVYYKYHQDWDEYTKVVVQFDTSECNGIGEVITAYQQDEITPGEKPEL